MEYVSLSAQEVFDKAGFVQYLVHLVATEQDV